MIEPQDAANGVEGRDRTSPRVFVSYAHGTPDHEDTVRALWMLLRTNGIDARLDLPAAEQRQDWPTWMTREVRDADFVLVIASAAYRERADDDAPPGAGRGAQFEASLMRDEFYGDRDTGLRRFLPVLLPGVTTAEIPAFLMPNGGTHYRVDALTRDGIERLLRVLTGQPYEIEPPLGEIPELPSRDATAAPPLPALEPPPALLHEIVLDVVLDEGRLRTTTTMAGTPLGDTREAPVPAGLSDVWRDLSTAGAPARLIDAGRRLMAALLDDDGLAQVVELIDRSPIGEVVEVVVVAEGAALALPYELLRLPRQKLLATVPGVRMRRRVRGIDRTATPPLPGPLKILVAVGAPTETKNAPLDVEAEMQAILDALAGIEVSQPAQVKILEVAGPEEITAALKADRYHVLHLSAHGSPSSIELEDEDGNAVNVSADDLATVLRAGGHPLPLVVLSSCAGGAGGSDGLAATLVARGADRVLAMQAQVTDDYATALARTLYEVLAAPGGASPGSALADARTAVQAQAAAAARSSGGSPWPPEYALPTLFCACNDPPLVDPAAAPVELSTPTIAPTGRGVRRLPIGRLIGRREELRTAMAVLRGGQAAIDRFGDVSGVLLTGVGGIGKTALAGRIETRLAAEGWMPAVVFGSWNPSELTKAVVGALDAGADDGLREARDLLTRPDVDDTTRLEVVAQLLTQTKLLVLFDDFEQNLSVTDAGVAFSDPGFEEVFGELCAVADVGRLLVTSRYPVPGAETLLHRIALRSLSPAELRRLLLRLPALRDLAGEERRAVIDTIGGHPRLLEFANALLRGGKSNLKEVSARLRRLSEPGEKLAAKRSTPEAIRDAVLLGSRDILLDELWSLLTGEQRELLLQAAVSREPQSLAELAVSRWGPDPSTDRRRAVIADAEQLVDLTLLSVASDDDIVVHPWIAGALAERHEDGLAQRHRRAAAMRLARLEAGRVEFADLVEICRHHAGAGQHDELTQFARAAFTAIEQQLGELSVAAFLGEVLPLVPEEHPNHGALGGREVYALLNTGRVTAARERAAELLVVAARQLEANPSSDSLRRALAVRHERMGDLLLPLGDSEGAEAHYRASLQIAETRIADNPEHTESQRFISVTYSKLGDLLLRLGDGAGAERHYRDDLAISERLAAADPTNARAQRDLSISYDRLGDLLLRLGDTAGAERHYLDSLTINEQLATTDPTNAEAQRDLSVSYSKLGDLLLRLGDGAGAERHYLDSLTIHQQLAATDPTNTRAQRDLSISNDRFGDLLLRLGDTTGAERHYRDSLTIREQLAATDPTNAQAQRDLSISNDRLGDLLLRLGDGAGAERHYRDSLTISEQLATSDPTNTETQRDLSISYNKLGDLLLRLGDGAGAERHYRDSLTINEQLATTDPTNTQAQRDLSISYERLGDVLLRLGDGAGAERHYRDSLTISEQLAATDPTNTETQRDLSVSYNKLGDLLLRLGDTTGAERHYRDSLTIREQLAATDPTNIQAQTDLAMGHEKLGDIGARADDRARAERHYRDALAIAERIAPDDPWLDDVRSKLRGLSGDDSAAPDGPV